MGTSTALARRHPTIRALWISPSMPCPREPARVSKSLPPSTSKSSTTLCSSGPVGGSPNTGMFLFKIINNGSEAIRTYVKLGRASATTIEVLDGLKEGDKVILSDVSVGEAERLRITDDQHVLKH